MEMNYEEKYNEILEWARKNKARLNGVSIEEVLPELSESEEERIRQSLLAYIKGESKRLDTKKWIDYLEKQKEQKPWKVGENAYFDPNTDMWFIKKKQKPAEWSEEEKRKLNRIYGILGQAADEKPFGSSKRIIGDKEAVELQDFIKSLRPQSHWKPSEVCYGPTGDPDPAGTSDLEEAAEEYVSKTLCDPDDGPSTGLAKGGFIAGAEWQYKNTITFLSEVMFQDMKKGICGWGEIPKKK